jgi:hypothetical protein
MIDAKTEYRSNTTRLGWGILLGLSALLILNGVVWFFLGGSLMPFEREVGVSLEELRQAYPTVVEYVATQARQLAIWFIVAGLLAVSVTRQGFEHHSRWAWRSGWILVGGLAAVAINALSLGEPPFGLLVLALSAIGFIGQLLAGKELAS